jgi:hypothetical protein
LAGHAGAYVMQQFNAAAPRARAGREVKESRTAHAR